MTICFRMTLIALAAAASLSAPITASAQRLALDFQPTGGTTEPGFEAFEETNQVLPDGNGGTDYSAFGTTVNVSLSTSNLPDSNLDFRAVARNGAADEKENDWLGSDTRTGGMDVGLTVTVAGLPTGLYSWLSTHHDGGSGATNGNLNGTVDYEFIDANGSSGLIADGITISEQDNADPISTFSRLFESDGSGDVVLSMIMDGGQGGTDNALFAMINSVEISVIPEPTSFVLLGLGLAGLAATRRR